jgi:hypothetical protein
MDNPSQYASYGSGALAVGSGALSAVGAIKQGNATAEADNAQAAALMQQSNQAIQSARDQAAIIRRNGASAQGAARTAAAASGVDVNSGSAALDVQHIGNQANSDALAAITNGARQAVTLQTNAQQVQAAGENAKSASRVSALASGLSSFSRWKMAKGAVANGYGSSYDGFNDPSNYG